MAEAATFFLLRHGETGAGKVFRGSIDDELTEVGWQQMRDAVAGLESVHHVYSSPMKRCQHFAEYFAGELGKRVTVVRDLREMDFGTWEGMSSADVMEHDPDGLKQFWEDPFSYTPPGGESLQQFIDRVIPAWQSIHKQDASINLVVTHGGVIRVVKSFIAGSDYRDLMTFEVANGSLHRV